MKGRRRSFRYEPWLRWNNTRFDETKDHWTNFDLFLEILIWLPPFFHTHVYVLPKRKTKLAKNFPKILMKTGQRGEVSKMDSSFLLCKPENSKWWKMKIEKKCFLWNRSEIMWFTFVIIFNEDNRSERIPAKTFEKCTKLYHNFNCHFTTKLSPPLCD